VFIRAPRIEQVSDEVEVLATLDHGDGAGVHPVLVRQGHVWGLSFHPELSGDTRVHELFLKSL
jgi:5'-phosphate synthase pdxT subunit